MHQIMVYDDMIVLEVWVEWCGIKTVISVSASNDGRGESLV